MDPGFPIGGGTNPGGRQHTKLSDFPKNCMKLRKFWSVGVGEGIRHCRNNHHGPRLNKYDLRGGSRIPRRRGLQHMILPNFPPNCMRQECIPVGCVPPAAVAVRGGSPAGTPPPGAGPPDQAPPGSRYPLWTESQTPVKI